MAKRGKSLWTDGVSSACCLRPGGEPAPTSNVTQRPWPSLLFILPMLVIFELGSYLRTKTAPTPRRNWWRPIS